MPDDTAMKDRSTIWSMGRSAGSSFSKLKVYAKYYWIGEEFGALVSYLKEKRINDETMVIFVK